MLDLQEVEWLPESGRAPSGKITMSKGCKPQKQEEPGLETAKQEEQGLTVRARRKRRDAGLRGEGFVDYLQGLLDERNKLEEQEQGLHVGFAGGRMDPARPVAVTWLSRSTCASLSTGPTVCFLPVSPGAHAS